MSTVFISHVEEDGTTAIVLANLLEKGGWRTWYYERDAVVGVSYLLQTGDEIARCKAVVLIISTHSLRSHQVGKEVVRAHEEGKPFFPVLVDLSDSDYKRRQPEWREAIGAATSIDLARGVEAVAASIVQGLLWLGCATNEMSPQGPTNTLVEVGVPELWIVQECGYEVFDPKSDDKDMALEWRFRYRARIGLIYLGKAPIYAVSAEHKGAGGPERHTVTCRNWNFQGGTSLTSLRPGDFCNLFVLSDSEIDPHSVILLRWVTPNGIPRRAELTLSVAKGAATVAPTRLVGEGVPDPEER